MAVPPNPLLNLLPPLELKLPIRSFRELIVQKKEPRSLQIIPATQHILDHYQHFTSEEKNQLWKLVLKKFTVYRSQAGELSIHLYPNLPQSV